MHAHHYPSHQRHVSQRQTLPLLFHDLRAASEIFFPVAVLPEQFFAPADGSDKTCGVFALMRAVLEEAVHCLQQQSLKSGRRAQRLTREAEEWFFTDDPHWLFSFVNICAVLGLDPAYIRRGLMQWRQHHAAALQQTERRTRLARRPLRAAA
jgi:hypothetical protein